MSLFHFGIKSTRIQWNLQQINVIKLFGLPNYSKNHSFYFHLPLVVWKHDILLVLVKEHAP